MYLMFRNILIIAISITFSNMLFAEKNPVVARVNGVQITLNELNSNYNNAKLFVTDKVVSKDKILNDLINRYLGINKAKKERLHENQ